LKPKSRISTYIRRSINPKSCTQLSHPLLGKWWRRYPAFWTNHFWFQLVDRPCPYKCHRCYDFVIQDCIRQGPLASFCSCSCFFFSPFEALLTLIDLLTSLLSIRSIRIQERSSQSNSLGSQSERLDLGVQSTSEDQHNEPRSAQTLNANSPHQSLS
jgi:hypothetical protein